MLKRAVIGVGVALSAGYFHLNAVDKVRDEEKQIYGRNVESAVAFAKNKHQEDLDFFKSMIASQIPPAPSQDSKPFVEKNPHLRYKFAQRNTDMDGGPTKETVFVIVTLEKLPDTKSNESRSLKKGQNTNFEKYRANKMKVLKITDEKGNNYTSAQSDFDQSFIYKVGEVVEVSNFEEDLEKICGPGIHYYRSYQSALTHGWMGKVYVDAHQAEYSNDFFTMTCYLSGLCELSHAKSGGSHTNRILRFVSDRPLGLLNDYHMETDPNVVYLDQ